MNVSCSVVTFVAMETTVLVESYTVRHECVLQCGYRCRNSMAFICTQLSEYNAILSFHDAFMNDIIHVIQPVNHDI